MIEPSPWLLIAAASAFMGLRVAEDDIDGSDDGTALLHRWGYWAVAAARYILRHVLRVARRFLPTRGGDRRGEPRDPRRAEGGGMTVRRSHLTLTRGGLSQGDSARSEKGPETRDQASQRRAARSTLLA